MAQRRHSHDATLPAKSCFSILQTAEMPLEQTLILWNPDFSCLCQLDSLIFIFESCRRPTFREQNATRLHQHQKVPVRETGVGGDVSPQPPAPTWSLCLSGIISFHGVCSSGWDWTQRMRRHDAVLLTRSSSRPSHSGAFKVASRLQSLLDRAASLKLSCCCLIDLVQIRKPKSVWWEISWR